MRLPIKWLTRIGLGLAGLCAVGYVAFFFGSQLVMDKKWPVTAVAVRAAQGPAAVAEGARLARLYGCQDCHGTELRGRLYVDEPGIASLWAPNLTLKSAAYSDADFARAIRLGVDPKGRALITMPSVAYSRLSDQETGEIIAFIRSLRPGGEVRPLSNVGWVGRLGLITNDYRTAPVEVANAKAHPLPDLGPQFAVGRSLARACVECHGADLSGDKGVGSPSLSVVKDYNAQQFEKLLLVGRSNTGHELDLMSATARRRFNGLSSADMAALYAYLRQRARAEP
jgi:cytochrome c553